MIQTSFTPGSFEDMGVLVQVAHRGKQLYLMSAYEDYCTLEGVRGRTDLVIVGAEQGFAGRMREVESFEAKSTLAREYGAIVIASHPYTIWDPRGPRGVVRFRLASARDRHTIHSKVFTSVDCVDLVATNCMWMVQSNELVQHHYPGKPLCTSDAHAISGSVRREIGRSGSIFRSECLDSTTGFGK